MDPIIRKFSRLFELSAEEKSLLHQLHDDYEDIDPKTVIVSSDRPDNHSYLLQFGWAVVYKDLPDGTQQILSFAIPGDFLGLYSAILGRTEYTIETVTRARICQLRWDQITEIFGNYPRLAMAICWLGARDQVFLREQVVRIGRQSAFNRTGHLFLELFERLDNIGHVRDNSFECPVTQEMLADALGLTTVHVNRTLKKLRKSGMVDISGGRLTVIDRDKLAELTDFDDGYLRRSGFPDALARQPDIK